LFETTTGTQARSIPKSQWQCKAGFTKEPRYSTTMNDEQELGNIPFSTEVVSPIVLSQPYEGGSEGNMDLPEQQEHQEEEYDCADEEEKEASMQAELTSGQNESERSQPADREYQYVAFESVLDEYDSQDEDKWCEMDLLAFKASSDPDTMYHH
jgi:hypothetical protein